jgi:hypothetical protein
MCGSA